MPLALVFGALSLFTLEAAGVERFNERFGPDSGKRTTEVEADIDFPKIIERARRAGASLPRLRPGEYHSFGEIRDSLLALAEARSDPTVDALIWDFALVCHQDGRHRSIARELFQFLISDSPDFRAEARVALSMSEAEPAAARASLDWALIEFALRPARPDDPGREVNAARVARSVEQSQRLLEAQAAFETWLRSPNEQGICGMIEPPLPDPGCATFDVGQRVRPSLRSSARLPGARWDAALLWAARWAFETAADGCTEEGARRFSTLLAIAEAFLDGDAEELASAAYAIDRDDPSMQGALAAACNFLHLLPEGRSVSLEEDHPLHGRHLGCGLP